MNCGMFSMTSGLWPLLICSTTLAVTTKNVSRCLGTKLPLVRIIVSRYHLTSTCHFLQSLHLPSPGKLLLIPFTADWDITSSWKPSLVSQTQLCLLLWFSAVCLFTWTMRPAHFMTTAWSSIDCESLRDMAHLPLPSCAQAQWGNHIQKIWGDSEDKGGPVISAALCSGRNRGEGS